MNLRNYETCCIIKHTRIRVYTNSTSAYDVCVCVCVCVTVRLTHTVQLTPKQQTGQEHKSNLDHTMPLSSWTYY